MKRVIGTFQMVFGALLICGGLLHVASLVPAFDMATSGSSSAGARLIVSAALSILFFAWGLRSIKAGRARFAAASDAEFQEAMALVRRTSAPSVRRGEQVAEDCYQNGLLKGRGVLLADVEKQIRMDHPHNSEAVKHGFLGRMLAYVESGEVLNLSVEGGNTLFVHRVQGKAVLDALLNRQGQQAD